MLYNSTENKIRGIFVLCIKGGIMTIGNNIKKYRKELKLTQAELAEKIKVLPHHVNRWENDRYAPSIENLKELSKALGVSVDGILFTPKERKCLRISDKELLDKIQDLDKLTPEDRITIANMIDALKAKATKT